MKAHFFTWQPVAQSVWWRLAFLLAVVSPGNAVAQRASAPWLWWHPTTNLDMVYSEVRMEKSVPGSYFMAMQGGDEMEAYFYLGFQEEGAYYRKHLHFTLWDPTGDIAWIAPDVAAKRLYSEGTGWTIYCPFNWQTNVDYRLCVRITDEGTNSLYHAWFFDPATAFWKHLVSIPRLVPHERISLFGSSLEDRGAHYWLSRSYLVGNQWGRHNDQWLDLSSASYTFASGYDTNTVDADVVGRWFRLETGGDTIADTGDWTKLVRDPGVQPTDLPEPPVFTNASRPRILQLSLENNRAQLVWDQPTNRFIVEAFPYLSSASELRATSSGLTTNGIEFPRAGTRQEFYRLRFGLQAVDFVDPGLEAAVREALDAKHTPTNAIYEEDLVYLPSLTACNLGITNLTGLDHCSVLGVVWLTHNQITDLTQLGTLPYLKELVLEANQISDVTPLRASTNLQILDLSYNQIASVDALSNLTALTSLNLGSNPQLCDLMSLRRLEHLTDLSLPGDQVAEIAALANLPKLQVLNLDHNQICDIGPLQSLTNLTVLYLGANRISNLIPLQGLQNLTGLSIACDQVSEIAALANLPKLQVLNLDHNQISDISPLQSLTNLTVLYLGANRITDLGPLIANAANGGLGPGDGLVLSGNPLSEFAQTNQIPILRDLYGVTVYWP